MNVSGTLFFKSGGVLGLHFGVIGLHFERLVSSDIWALGLGAHPWLWLLREGCTKGRRKDTVGQQGSTQDESLQEETGRQETDVLVTHAGYPAKQGRRIINNKSAVFHEQSRSS